MTLRSNSSASNENNIVTSVVSNVTNNSSTYYGPVYTGPVIKVNLTGAQEQQAAALINAATPSIGVKSQTNTNSSSSHAAMKKGLSVAKGQEDEDDAVLTLLELAGGYKPVIEKRKEEVPVKNEPKSDAKNSSDSSKKMRIESLFNNDTPVTTKSFQL